MTRRSRRLVQVTPTRGRKAISYLTLYGAYASTVFWVIGHYLNEAYGWRGTLMIFAASTWPSACPSTGSGSRGARPKEDMAAGHECRRPRPMVPCSKDRMRVVGIGLVRTHHVDQRLRVRGHLAAARAPARGGGSCRRNGGLGRLAQGPWPVRRPARRDILRAQPQGDDHRPHCHRRGAGVAAPALPRARRVLAARCLHAAAGRRARCHHDRARRRPARALWCQGLWRGAWPDRDADPACQCLLAGPLRPAWSTNSAGRPRSTRCLAARSRPGSPSS